MKIARVAWHKLAVRFSEPSSWAGIAAIALLAGVNLDPGLLHSVSLVGAGICGVVSFFLPEGDSTSA